MKYYCKCCDYSTNHEGRYSRHTISVKHKNQELDYYIGKDTDDKKDNKKEDNGKKIVCEYCDKEFNYKSSKSMHISGLLCDKLPKSIMDKIHKKQKGKQRKKKIKRKDEKEEKKTVISQNISDSNLGILYLVQPGELIGTDRYKIGYSNSCSLKRVLSYKKGTLYLSIKQLIIQKKLKLN